MTTSNRPDCVFCTLAKDRIVAETALVITLGDGFPVSPGHTLIIPTGARPNETVQAVSVTARRSLDGAKRNPGLPSNALFRQLKRGCSRISLALHPGYEGSNPSRLSKTSSAPGAPCPMSLTPSP